MDQSALIDKKTLARALSISLRTVTTLVSTKRIPVIRITRKIVRFNLPEVMAALGRPEVP
jgi:excisionase family DNA binding protein